MHGALVLGAATVLVAGRVADAWLASKRPPPERPDTTILKGWAEVHGIAPDHIKWELRIGVQARTPDEARRELASDTAAAIDQLAAAGIEKTEIELGYSGIEEAHLDKEGRLSLGDQGEGRLTGYHGSQHIEVDSRRVPVARAAYTSLALSAPAWLTLESPECTLLDSSGALKRARDAAWRDLQAQIDEVTSRTGRKLLGRIVDVVQPTGEMATFEEASPCADGLTASAEAQLTYELR